MKFFEKNRFYTLIFVLIFVALGFIYNYHVSFFKPPQSLHIWRQTNSLSITQMYYQSNLPLLQPEIQSQLADGGTSGKAMGEFPILYYMVAKAWLVFGKSEALFRIFQLLILFAGLFSLFRMLIPLTGNAVRAGFVSLMLFTSPMLIFYGPNFIPDGPSLAFVFVSWLFLYKFTLSRKFYLIWLSALFVFMSLSLKIITGTSVVAIGVWALIEPIFVKKEQQILKFQLKHFIPFLISILGVILWYFYVAYYSARHGVQFSIHDIIPIWKIDNSQIIVITNSIKEIFLKEYFSPQLQVLSIAIYIYLLFNLKSMHPFCAYLLIVMPLGMLAILILWFQVLEGHDYYLISQIQVMAIVWAVFFIHIKNTSLGQKPYIYIAMIIGFLVLVHDGYFRQSVRFEGWMNKSYKANFEALTELEPYFEKWGIKPDDRVISIPDNSLTASLYYMNRKGNTNFGIDFSKSESFAYCMERGAKYLILNDTNYQNSPVLRKYTSDYIGRYRNIKAYRLSY